MSKVDLFVLNESEARLLAETSNLVEAGAILLKQGPANVIIKLGEFGAILFTAGGEMFRCPAWPLAELADPTGAGDSFLGAMAGYLSSLSKKVFTKEDLAQAMVRGSVVASYTCEAFSTQSLQDVKRDEIDERLQQLHAMSCWNL